MATKSVSLLESIYRAPGLKRVKTLNAGLPASAFPALAEMLAVTTSALAAALGLSERTLRERTRKPTGRLNADEAERSFRAFRVFKRATEVLGDEETARAWLTHPQRALGESRPIDLLARDVGTEEVLNLLGMIHEHVYV